MKQIKNYILEHLSVPDNIKAFTIIKPGFTKYADEINKYIIDKGFIMHDHFNTVISDKDAHKLYNCHKDQDWFEDLCKYMSSGESQISMWLFDHEKHPDVNTIKLMKDIKHHFRDKYGINEMKNCMHSSDSLDHVYKEAKILFK